MKATQQTQSVVGTATERIRYEVHQQWSDGDWRLQRPTYKTLEEAEEQLRKAMSRVIIPGFVHIGKGEDRPAFRICKSVAQVEVLKDIPKGKY